jgi:hypothetical protein
MDSGHHSRRIFHRLSYADYDNFELQSIEEFRKYLKREGVDAVFDDHTLLRFLYSSSFKLNDAGARTGQYY